MQTILLCFCLATLKPSLALRWQSRRPVVSGTEWLEPEELAGRRPLFVDAFLNQIGGSVTPVWAARIVLSYNPMFGCVRMVLKNKKKLNEEPSEWEEEEEEVKGIPNAPDACQRSRWALWKQAKWSCRWREPGLSLARQATMVEEAEVLHDSGEEVNESLSDGDQRGLNESSDARPLRLMSYGMHHALVVGCRLPPMLAHLQEWQLDVTATLEGSEIYSRKQIPVRTSTFVRPGVELAMCTMVNARSDMLWHWAKFHAQTGFDQILVYVEEADVKPVAEQVSDLVASGVVTIVPFFFGAVSLQKLFYMQASMEQHCMYQAKGRATWLGHSDIDEFFELRGSLRQAGLKAYLNSLPKKTPGVVVRSQFWHDNMSSPHPGAEKLPFPCNLTCKIPGYFDAGRRSKWIARPEMVQVIDPHNLETTGAGVSARAGFALKGKGPGKVAGAGAGKDTGKHAGAPEARFDAGDNKGAGKGDAAPAANGGKGVVFNAGMAFPNPESELRVNHFRHCSESSHCQIPAGAVKADFAGVCEEDDSFAGYCTAQLLMAVPKQSA